MNKMKLGDILEIQPKSKIKAGEGIINGKYPFYTCSNELTKSINTADYEGDVLIMGTGGMASIHYEKGKFSTSTDCLVYKSNKNVNLSLINKYLRTNIYLLENGFKGAGLRHVSRDYISNITIPLPERNLQDKIVTELDLIEKTITNHNDVLKKYDTLIKSRFIEMFGDNPVENGKWKVEKLGNLVTVTSSKRIYAEEQSTEGIPFLRISDLVSKINGIDSNDLYIPEEKYHEFVENGLVPNVDDILVTSRGTLGLCYTITADDKFYFQDGMITWLKFSNHESILSIFLSFLFNVILKQKIDLKTNGATVKYVSISELKNLEIPVPPLELQQQFADFVQQIDKSKFEIWRYLKFSDIMNKIGFRLYD